MLHFMSQINIGDLAALLAVLVTLLTFAWQLHRGNMLRRAEVYQSLEMASNELFRFEAAHADALAPMYSPIGPQTPPPAQDMIWRSFIFQTMNLFEMALRFRAARVFEPELYKTWVAWNYDLLSNPYFRAIWDEVKANYSDDIQRLFDRFAKTYDDFNDDTARWNAFIGHAASLLNCPHVRSLKRAGETDGPSTRHPARPQTDVRFDWIEKPGIDEAIVTFFIAQSTSDPAYISHSEIMTGMSKDGKQWDKDAAAAVTRQWLMALDASPSAPPALAARGSGGQLLAVAFLTWHLDGPCRHLIVEDMAVAPTARRQGLGGTMLDMIEQRARDNGAAWIFLESGLHNSTAHRFFAKHAFQPISKVFGRRLADLPLSRPQ